MMDSSEMKNQAQYIWNRLEDLASTDPDAYKNFIDQQMKERDKYMSSPEPKFCFMTHIKEESSQEVFVNVCGWKRISYPSNDTEPLNLTCGFKVWHKDRKNGNAYLSIPVAANDKAVDELLKSNLDKVDLIKLIIEFILQTQKINITREFKTCKEIFKGDLPADPKRLFIKNPQSEFSEASIKDLLKKGTVPDDLLSSPENLIKNLSTDDKIDAPTHKNSEKDFIETLMSSKEDKDKNLIEEVDKVIQTPDFSLSHEKDEFGEVDKLLLKINLPFVESAANCDLNISRSEVELAVPGLYQLKVELPRLIDDEAARAQFRKKTSCLVLTMPVNRASLS